MGTEIRIPFGKLDTRFAMIAMRLETKDTHLLYTSLLHKLRPICGECDINKLSKR